MLSSTLIHLAINWDDLDPVYKYVSVDSYGIWAHVEKPTKDEGGYHTKGSKYLARGACVLFERGNADAIELMEEM